MKSFIEILLVILLLLLYWLYHYLRWKPLAYLIITGSFVLQCIMYNYFMREIQVD
jgi:glucan phosphoethanolaminetransferase (alkaline phosphatase superfamily)